MNKFIKLPFLVILVGSLILSAIFASNTFKTLRLKDRKVLDFQQLFQDIKDKKIILVGEIHDEPKHHKYQLEIIQALHEKDVPMAIGLEMFKASSQSVLDNWLAGKLTLRNFISIYYQEWGAPWPLYRDIFLYAKEHKIPLVGLNIPREITDKVAQKGFKQLTKTEMGRLPYRISCDVDNNYREHIKKTHAVHTSGDRFEHFCEAQIVWDSAMALQTIEFIEKNPQHSIVVLAGIGHVQKQAIPARIRKSARKSYSIASVSPEIPPELEKSKITSQDLDYLIFE